MASLESTARVAPGRSVTAADDATVTPFKRTRAFTFDGDAGTSAIATSAVAGADRPTAVVIAALASAAP